MSTDQQQRSLDNQAAVIAEFAAAEGYEIVRSFTDPGVSGVTFQDRPALRELLSVVVGGQADFDVILVSDVSRWGRFQDLDEAAHYEFLCREAGLPILYCAEPPDIADPQLGPIVKQLKRALSAEFSRERSELVRAAQRTTAAEGLNPAGRVAYGVRRALREASGEEVGVLGEGERKMLQEQRVGFAHGPPSEVAVIQTIFDEYTRGRLRRGEIAKRLQASGVPRPFGGRWTGTTIDRTLRNEIYAGTHVFGRSTEALRTKPRPTPRSTWVRAEAMDPIVPKATFEAAQALLAVKSHYTDEDLLNGARRILAETGRLSAELIRTSPHTPDVKVYSKRFGSLRRLYERLGYRPEPVRRVSDAELLEALRDLHRRHGVVTGPMLAADAKLPDPGTYHRRFGSLRRAYELAGLSENYLQARRARRARRKGKKASAADE